MNEPPQRKPAHPRRKDPSTPLSFREARTYQAMMTQDAERPARPRRNLRSLALRGLLAGLAAGAIAATGFTSLAVAQAIAGVDPNQAVNYAADRIELQDRQNRVVLSGDVVVTQGDLRLAAQRMIVGYTDNGSLQIQRIAATGGVRVNRGAETARGDAGIYDFNRRVITLSGGVALQRGGDTLNGGRLVIDLNTGRASVDGRADAPGGAPSQGGRVTGSFSVPQ